MTTSPEATDSALFAASDSIICDGCSSSIGTIRSTVFPALSHPALLSFSLQKSAGSAPQRHTGLMTALQLARTRVRNGNLPGAYMIFDTLIANTQDAFVASMAASTALHYEIGNARMHPDSMETGMQRNATFLEARISAATCSIWPWAWSGRRAW